jgi:hypothetical protein
LCLNGLLTSEGGEESHVEEAAAIKSTDKLFSIRGWGTLGDRSQDVPIPLSREECAEIRRVWEHARDDQLESAPRGLTVFVGSDAHRPVSLLPLSEGLIITYFKFKGVLFHDADT